MRVLLAYFYSLHKMEKLCFKYFQILVVSSTFDSTSVRLSRKFDFLGETPDLDFSFDLLYQIPYNMEHGTWKDAILRNIDRSMPIFATRTYCKKLMSRFIRKILSNCFLCYQNNRFYFLIIIYQGDYPKLTLKLMEQIVV